MSRPSFHMCDTSIASETAVVGLCLFLDRGSPVFGQQCNARRNLDTDWTPYGTTLSASISKFSKLASIAADVRVQELRESRGGRPGLHVLMSLTVSVDVKQH